MNLKLDKKWALLHFHTPPFVIDDSSWKNAAESFTVALTLTLGGYESAIAPKNESYHNAFTELLIAFVFLYLLILSILVTIEPTNLASEKTWSNLLIWLIYLTLFPNFQITLGLEVKWLCGFTEFTAHRFYNNGMPQFMSMSWYDINSIWFIHSL